MAEGTRVDNFRLIVTNGDEFTPAFACKCIVIANTTPASAVALLQFQRASDNTDIFKVALQGDETKVIPGPIHFPGGCRVVFDAGTAETCFITEEDV
jgi:hypothetical protein